MKLSIAIMMLASGVCLAEDPTPPAWSIDQAEYRLVVERDRVETTVELSGRALEEKPGPVALFNHEAVIGNIQDVSGGALAGDEQRQIVLIPDGKKKFRIQLTLLAKVHEDSQSAYVTLGIPPALKNSLSVKLPAGMRLIEAPGIPDRDACFHFSARDNVSVRFSDRPTPSTRPLVEIDSFSRIRIQGKRIVLTTFFRPLRPMPDTATLQMPPGATFLESSLNASWIGPGGKETYEIKLPLDFREVFSVDLALEQTTGTAQFSLPRIQDNTGNEGFFAVEEPDDGQVSVEGKGLVERVPPGRLSADLAAQAMKAEKIMRIPSSEDLRLSIRRFLAVSAPAVVLPEQRFFSAFEENGNVLSVLILDVPARTGQRLRIKSVPDAEIWSLTVNSQPARVYGDADTWVIPLSEGKASHIELAYLRHGSKLGLQGRLETMIPETGLPAENFRVGLALPQRVELLSIEGPVNPDPEGAWSLPGKPVGRAHFFSRAFHKGDGMNLALSYKEPVKRK